MREELRQRIKDRYEAADLFELFIDKNIDLFIEKFEDELQEAYDNGELDV